MAHFNEDEIRQIWDKAQMIEGYNPDIWRQDFAGAWIRRDLYGTTQKYGWEIDHLKPISFGGSDTINNLYPLHWMNNRRKGNDYPKFFTSVTSANNINIEQEKSWRVR